MIDTGERGRARAGQGADRRARRRRGVRSGRRRAVHGLAAQHRLGRGGSWWSASRAAQIPQIPANLLLVKNAAAIGFYWGSYRRHDPARVHAAFEQLLQWHAEGRIRPHVSEMRPLAEARGALELLLARQSTGKVVLTVDDAH